MTSQETTPKPWSLPLCKRFDDQRHRQSPQTQSRDRHVTAHRLKDHRQGLSTGQGVASRPSLPRLPNHLSRWNALQGEGSGEDRLKGRLHRTGINQYGQKEVLGIWVSETEGAKFWMKC